MNTLYLICGKTGSGKTYISKLMEKEYHIKRLKKVTTRPRRDGEDDSEYEFITKEKYDTIVSGGNVLESKFNVVDENGEQNDTWYYAVLPPELNESSDYLAVVDSQMIQNADFDLLNSTFCAKYVYILYITADAETRLERCIVRNDNPNYTEICRRFIAESKEYEFLNSINNIALYKNLPDNVYYMKINNTFSDINFRDSTSGIELSTIIDYNRYKTNSMP